MSLINMKWFQDDIHKILCGSKMMSVMNMTEFKDD